MEAPPENFAYTLPLSPDFSKPDALAVIDVKPDDVPAAARSNMVKINGQVVAISRREIDALSMCAAPTSLRAPSAMLEQHAIEPEFARTDDPR
jgi:hypothetical protein